MYGVFIVLFLLIVLWYYTVYVRDRSWCNASIHNPAEFQEILTKYGVAIIPNVFEENEVDELRKITKDIDSNEYGNINTPKNRKDKIIQIDHVKPKLQRLYQKNPLFWKKVFPNYQITECSLLTSYPKAHGQPWHMDTEYEENNGDLISIGVTLDTVEENMGPLEVFPGSHKTVLYKNDILESILNPLGDHIPILQEMITYIKFRLWGFYPEKCMCPKGSLVFWSSQVMHRGSANTSKKERPVFYFSLLEPNKRRPDGATYSLSSRDNKQRIIYNHTF